MDLLCPHCTRRITVPDDKAGMILACPLCAKQFMAPSLPPPPIVPNPPPAPAPIASVSAVPPPPRPNEASVQVKAPPPPPPPAPPGEYRYTYTLHLRGNWLAFVPAGCLVLIFVLSFFTWHVVQVQEYTVSLGMWGLVFSEKYSEPRFLAYFLVFVVCAFLTAMSLLLEKQLIFVPPQMDAVKPFLMYKDLFVALFLGFDFLPLAYDYVDAHLIESMNPIALGLKLAVRVHLLAIVACLLLFWLHWRKTTNAPPPKCELRW